MVNKPKFCGMHQFPQCKHDGTSGGKRMSSKKPAKALGFKAGEESVEKIQTYSDGIWVIDVRKMFGFWVQNMDSFSVWWQHI